MERIGVRQLRQHASRYLDLVKAGETVEVTERGELVALLSPPSAPQRDRERLIASGALVAAPHATGRLRAPRAVSPDPGSPTNQDLLDAEREERL